MTQLFCITWKISIFEQHLKLWSLYVIQEYPFQLLTNETAVFIVYWVIMQKPQLVSNMIFVIQSWHFSCFESDATKHPRFNTMTHVIHSWHLSFYQIRYCKNPHLYQYHDMFHVLNWICKIHIHTCLTTMTGHIFMTFVTFWNRYCKPTFLLNTMSWHLPCFEPDLTKNTHTFQYHDSIPWRLPYTYNIRHVIWIRYCKNPHLYHYHNFCLILMIFFVL